MRWRRRWHHFTESLAESSWFRPVLAIVVVGLVGGGGGWLVVRMGPGSPDDPVAAATALQEQAEVEAWKREVEELSARFEAKVGVVPIGPDEVALLARARDLQERVVRKVSLRRGPEEERLRALHRRHDEMAAVDLAAETLNLEAAGRKALAAGDRDDALFQLRQAAERQERLNRLYPAAPQRDLGRVLRLQGEARELQLEPEHRRSVALEAEGEALLARGEWDGAETKLLEAKAIVDRFIEDHRGSAFADRGRASHLERTLVEIRSGRLAVAVAEKTAQAEARSAIGRGREAAALFLEARTLQKQINDQFRESPHASAARLDELEIRRQTALGADIAATLRAERDALAEALLVGETIEASRRAVVVIREMEELKRLYPRSRDVDDELLLRVRFIDLLGPELGRVQRAVQERLVPLAGGGGRILATEVWQSLYQQLVGSNPSRQLGEQRPVDSVTWSEAVEFTKRLGWILGREVRLPTREEWRRQLGDLRYAPLDTWAWHAGNTPDGTRPVGTTSASPGGMHDLLGNVGEWLAAPDDSAEAEEAGGAARDPAEVLIDAPVRPRLKTERNRWTGFRVVVMDEAGARAIEG